MNLFQNVCNGKVNSEINNVFIESFVIETVHGKQLYVEAKFDRNCHLTIF